MAELAISALGALSSATVGASTATAVGLTAAETAAAVASAGVGAASWAAGTTVTGGLASSALSTLSTVATVGSAVSALVSGVSGWRESQTQARFAGLNAEADRLAAEERALRIRREYVQKVGAARVAFAGSGLDISSGGAIEDALGAEADFETSLTRTSGDISAASGRAQAGSLRGRGVSGLAGALSRAAGLVIDNRIDIARRG